MTKHLLSTVLCGLFAGFSSGQTVLLSPSVPDADIVSSSPVGGIDTALFDEDFNTNHSRGQLFTLPTDGQYEITGITLQKSMEQAYVDDTLTMRIFQGTREQWESGTGHETAVDGDDYLVDTTVTLLHTESFTLSDTIPNNDFVTFEFANPVLVSGATDFGFFMTYNQNTGFEDRFRHRENGTGGGRLSITDIAHGATADTSRRIHFYIHGAEVDTGIVNPTLTASASLIEVGDSVDLTITFDTTADTASLSTPDGPVDLLQLDAADDLPNDGNVVVANSPIENFTYEVSVTKTGEEDESVSTSVSVINPANEAPDQAFSTALKSDSPLFYYRFEEEAGSEFLLDSSGNGNHVLDFDDTLALGDGPGGMQNAGRFDRSSILVPATSNMGASFTATAVVNVDFFESGAVQGLFSMADENLTGRSIFYISGGQLRSFIDGATTNNPGGSVPPNGTSCLFHFVFDADPDANPATPEQELRFYINGELQGDMGVTLVNPVAENEGNWVLGANKARTSQFLQGWMDEAAIFEAALSDERIAAHATAFFAAADPFLGYLSDTTMVNFGESVTLTWKISDQATSVTINGQAQTIDGGGVYTSTFTPLADTSYTIQVEGEGGPFSETVDVTVEGTPPAPPVITSISVDAATPLMVELQVKGAPNSTYFIKASANLNDGFPTELDDGVATDDEGNATVQVQTLAGFRFFRAEQRFE